MKFSVRKEKELALEKKMASLGIKESDLEEKFIRSSGKGGQKVNKTSSCAYIKHNPTGIEVKCQKERSQSLNRFLARRRLVEKIEKLILGKKSQIQQKRERGVRIMGKRNRTCAKYPPMAVTIFCKLSQLCKHYRISRDRNLANQ